jgi:uncharacterized membrane protein
MAKRKSRFPHIDAHHRTIAALVAAVITFMVVRTAGDRIHLPAQIIITWNGFACTALALAWWEICVSEPAIVIRTAKLQDSSRVLIFLFVIIAAFASLFAVGVLLGGAKNLSGTRLTLQLVLAATTVMSSWALVHTLFGLRYAHLYYTLDDNEDIECDGNGLQFPGEERPDYLDFAYFSFVVGMTCQVSDVQITERPIRRLALLHGVLAFVYNTVILALSINIASGLL